MKTARTYLVLGGARSGKTRHAMRLAERQPRRIYIATAEARDEEMRARIHLHRDQRDATWSTSETPIAIADAILANDAQKTSILVDCLTLWLANLLEQNRDPVAAVDAVVDVLRSADADIVFVSNEIGLGIVPINAETRAFRDAQGHLNQRIAATVDHVDFVAAGLTFSLKPGHGN